jgi:chitodextrinase
MMEGGQPLIYTNSGIADTHSEVADSSKKPIWFGMLVALTCLVLPLTASAAPTISYIQGNYATPQSSQVSVAVTFNSAQTAGDLNVIVVGWNDSTASVSSVLDSSGNTYQRAIGPTVVSGVLSQSIYYAKNIVSASAGANTVTVLFSSAASSPDVRVVEYSGADLSNPVDVTKAGTGKGGTSTSGSVTTTNTTDLIFGANTVTGSTKGPGTGFTQRILTVPDGDIVEDRMVAVTGTYSATAAVTGGRWIMQMVAFRTQVGGGGVDTQPPTAPTNLTSSAISATQINLSWTASTDNVGVTGYLVERCQGAGCTNFAQIGTTPATTFNDTTLTTGTAYSYRARAVDAAGNLSPYSNVASATTPASDTQPPTTPINLTATAVSGSQINLSWGASSDNVGVTGYLIQRCQGVGCTSFAPLTTVPTTTYSDTGLASNTNYTYQVKATDAAGNFSPYSNTATATTLATISGLIAAYTFDEGTGTTVNDLSGHGNTGTIANTTWTSAGKFGNALLFNGSSSVVTVNDSSSLHLTNSMTLEAWVNPSTVTSAWRDVIYKGNDNYFLEGTSDRSSVPAGGGTFGSAGGLVVASSSLVANTWAHLALTYDGAALRLYVNGVQVSSVAQTGSILTSTNPLQIGGDNIFGQYFAGTIDEVRIYNMALSQAQVQSDMGTPVGGGSGPVVSLSPNTINFGNVPTGTTSSAVPVTLSNVGSAPLTINSIAISGGNVGDFAQTNNCGTSLAPGSCTINVTFTPLTTGSRTSVLVVSDNAAGSPHTVSLSGTGTGFSISPRVAALTITRTQQFTASSGGATWSVDGVIGGSTAAGTITAAGLYTPPTSQGTHTVSATLSSQSASATVYITNYPGTFTHHNDNLRTGQNTKETVLTPGNVNQTQFGKLFTYTLDGIAFASPLYVANVNIPGQGFHDVVYMATEHDSVYAWDADGLSTSPLWKVSFLGPGITPVPCGDTGECGDIPNEIGITGTPVIDQASGTLYVVAKTKEGVNYVQRLHALDITTGAEKFGGPRMIQASVSGSGEGSQNGQLSFNALRENQRPALVLSNGNVYIGWGSHGDQHPWHGWVIAYNASNLQQAAVYCVSPDGYGGGIWASGGGLGADSNGNIFFNTGNGGFTVDTGGRDYGDTIVKVGPSGSVLDYFTPHDQAAMESQDLDLSSAGPVLLLDQPGSNPHLLIAAAKTGTIFVVNRDNMGHFRSGNDNQIVQSLVGILPNGTLEEGNFSAPAFFNGYVYFAAVNDTLKAFQLSNGLLSNGPTSHSLDVYPNRGGSFAVSGNGNANGIVWAVQDNNPQVGVLHAYDAGNLANEFYNTTQGGTRDTLGVATKFSIPLVANGKVFVGAQTQLVVYGLLP